MCFDLSRRKLIAASAALAIGAPLATAVASSEEAEDWPEFKPWLEKAQQIDDLHATWALDRDLGVDIDAETNAGYERLQRLEEAMFRRPVTTERQLAMIVAIVAYHYDQPPDAHFNVALLEPNRGVGLFELMTVLCRQAARVLPEVPFKFDAEA